MVKDRPEVPGARMMGVGLGGCTINLVRAGEAEILAAEIAVRYQEATNTPLKTYFVSIEDGAGQVTAPSYSDNVKSGSRTSSPPFRADSLARIPKQVIFAD